MKENHVKHICLCALFVAIIVCCTYISVPIGAVPVTLQTFAVCAAAGLLGFKRGTISVAVYVLMGTLGLPVFSSFSGGIGKILGPTGGYILGFLITAAVVGLVADKTIKVIPMIVSMTVGVLLCYVFGTLWFYFVYSSSADAMSFSKILLMCVIPFLIPDIVKIAAAVIVVNRVKKFIK